MKLGVAELRENKEAIKHMYNVQLLNANAIVQKLQEQGAEISYATITGNLRQQGYDVSTPTSIIFLNKLKEV